MSVTKTIGRLKRVNNRSTWVKHAISWTRLSCQGMGQNEVRLQLHALAYNLGTFLQGADLPEEVADWSLTSLQTCLIKIGARVVCHARAITFQLAEVAVTGPMVRAILAATPCMGRAQWTNPPSAETEGDSGVD